MFLDIEIVRGRLLFRLPGWFHDGSVTTDGVGGVQFAGYRDGLIDSMVDREIAGGDGMGFIVDLMEQRRETANMLPIAKEVAGRAS